jgi:hypothetical protein
VNICTEQFRNQQRHEKCLRQASCTLKKSLILAQKAHHINQGSTTLFCTLLSPIHLSFNSQQRPPPYGLSDLNIRTLAEPQLNRGSSKAYYAYVAVFRVRFH